MKIFKITPYAMAAFQVFLSVGASSALAEEATKKAVSTVQVAPSFPDHKSELSYAVGVTTARNLIRDGVEFDPEVVRRGMNDAIAGKLTMLSDTEIKSLMNSLVTDMRQRFIANRKTQEDANLKRGDDFRAAFARQAGVKVMPDGVLIKELEAGNGASAGPNDTVLVSYKGTLVDGKEFDATPEGKPVSLQVSKTIPGWRGALSIMQPGARWKIVIPSTLAYGERGIGTDIGPNETLVFEVKLLKVTKAE